MAKLYFRYSAMNSGKSTMAIQVAHNYEELDMLALVWKPAVDTKGGDTIVNRIGISRKVDKMISSSDSPIKILKEELDKGKKVKAIIFDEAQFLSENQVNELYYITKKMGIPIICYGLRCDFQMMPFPGSARLLAIADEIEEIKNMCKCGKKATQNLRMVNGKPIFDGEKIEIDGNNESITYRAVCGECYIDLYLERDKK